MPSSNMILLTNRIEFGHVIGEALRFHCNLEAASCCVLKTTFCYVLVDPYLHVAYHRLQLCTTSFRQENAESLMTYLFSDLSLHSLDGGSFLLSTDYDHFPLKLPISGCYEFACCEQVLRNNINVTSLLCPAAVAIGCKVQHGSRTIF